MDTMMTAETTGTKASPPRHDYRPLTHKPARSQKKRIILALPHPAKTPPSRTATVTRTQEGTLKGSGKTQKVAGLKVVGETSDVPEETVLMFRDKGKWVATVSVPTDVSVSEVVARVTKQRQAGRMSAGEASDLLYPFLFDGTVHERRSVFATLRKVATPETILETAFRTYRLQGYEGYLNEAASLLTGFGAAAWPTIRKWAQLGGAECESLVETAFSVPGVSDAERLDGLKDLVFHGDQNTRSRALGSIHLLPPRTRKDLLTLLTRTGQPDDPTRAEAEERLAEESA